MPVRDRTTFLSPCAASEGADMSNRWYRRAACGLLLAGILPCGVSFAKGEPKTRLGELLASLPQADFSSDQALEALVQGLAAQHGAGTGDYIHPARLAVSGTAVGPSFYGLIRVLGRDRVTRRIERFLSTA